MPLFLNIKNKYKRVAGINNRKELRAKKTCSSKYKSCGVKPTNAKKAMPKKIKSEPAKAIQ